MDNVRQTARAIRKLGDVKSQVFDAGTVEANAASGRATGRSVPPMEFLRKQGTKREHGQVDEDGGAYRQVGANESRYEALSRGMEAGQAASYLPVSLVEDRTGLPHTPTPAQKKNAVEAIKREVGDAVSSGPAAVRTAVRGARTIVLSAESELARVCEQNFIDTSSAKPSALYELVLMELNQLLEDWKHLTETGTMAMQSSSLT